MNITNRDSKATGVGSSASIQMPIASLVSLGIMSLLAILILLAIFRWLRPVFFGMTVTQFNVAGIAWGINTNRDSVGVMQSGVEADTNRGNSRAKLEACPKTIYSGKLLEDFRPPGSEEQREKIMCSCTICLDDYQESVDVLRLLPECGHMFHGACIDQWLALSPTCPICRQSL